MTDMAIPSGKEERRKLKTMIVEMTNVLSRIDSEREHYKEISSAANEEFEIEKKVINRLARTMYKNSYADLQAENEHFEFLYESVINNNSS